MHAPARNTHATCTQHARNTLANARNTHADARTARTCTQHARKWHAEKPVPPRAQAHVRPPPYLPSSSVLYSLRMSTPATCQTHARTQDSTQITLKRKHEQGTCNMSLPNSARSLRFQMRFASQYRPANSPCARSGQKVSLSPP
ncbi:unnamed protein product [Cyclocybe aegerita]|uniref:Uncharacterized protein n=1 Tax=Cyclocybe aegerita TaxID=1973307 RepID=A0A8S0VUE1_CYCAE|nr:unnamed protein product [Cyclocybe aegerita]